MKKEDQLLNELKMLSALIMKAKIENKSQVKLRQRFAKIQSEYKRYWLRNEAKTGVLTK